MHKEILAKRLKEARNDLGYSQEDIAEKLGIARPTLSHYETGKRQPDIDTLVALAEFYNVSLNWLAGATIEPPYYIPASNQAPEPKTRKTKKKRNQEAARPEL